MELRSRPKEVEAACSMMIDPAGSNGKQGAVIRLEVADRASKPPAVLVSSTIIQLLIVMNLLFASWHETGFQLIRTGAQAVSVQKLNVPDLVVIDQLNQQQHQHARSHPADQLHRTQGVNLNTNSQPEAASLINSQDLSGSNLNGEQQQQITFECLISFDRRKDKNLVVKWHHDDRIEPIYQWIPELNKRSIAPQYRAYIAPIVSAQPQPQSQQPQPAIHPAELTPAAGTNGTATTATSTLAASQQPNGSQQQNPIQLLEASFRLVRPSKELGGKYTCSAISTQNDDSKWKKMIVYTPPRSFRFNASRTDIGALLASQRERLIHPSMIGPASVAPAPASGSAPFSGQQPQHNQLPLAYRMRGFDGNHQAPFGQTTISPQMYSTIDYVNVNQQRARQASASPTSGVNYPSPASPPSPWLIGQPSAMANPLQAAFSQHHQDQPANKQMLLPASGVNQPPQQPTAARQPGKHNGVMLVCDIDQVFPVPEVSIYRLAKLDGSHPDKLAKLDTRIERNPLSGLYHVQVISILEDDELQMKYGLNEPVYFECLIALTNLELSKYSDNKRSIIYRPGLLTNSPLGAQTSSEDINSEQQASNSASSSSNLINNRALEHPKVLMGLGLVLMSSLWWSVYLSSPHYSVSSVISYLVR